MAMLLQNLLCIGIDFSCCSRGFYEILIFVGLLLIVMYPSTEPARCHSLSFSVCDESMLRNIITFNILSLHPSNGPSVFLLADISNPISCWANWEKMGHGLSISAGRWSFLPRRPHCSRWNWFIWCNILSYYHLLSIYFSKTALLGVRHMLFSSFQLKLFECYP